MLNGEWYCPPPSQPALPPGPPEHPPIEARYCIMCQMDTLIPLCWYLFGIYHCDCDCWACYCCKIRTRDGFWYQPDPSPLHTKFGLGDRL